MHHREDPQGLLFRSVGNQVLACQSEAERTRGEIRAAMALIGKGNQPTNGCQNFRDHPVGSVEIIGAYEFPNLLTGQDGLPGGSRIRS